jgi:hypothetical protein
MSLLTPSRSAALIPFQPQFEAWREAWHRQVIADSELTGADIKVAGFILWHLNREARRCFLRYQTIETGTSLSHRSAERGVGKLVDRGHLRREPRPGKSNYFYPIVKQGGVIPGTPGGSFLAPPGVSSLAPITSEIEPLIPTQEIRHAFDLKEGREGSRLPRKEGSPSKASANQPSPSRMNGSIPRGPATGGGDARGYYVCSGTPTMVALEEYERARERRFPRDKKGNWELSAAEYAAFTAWCASGEAAS